MFLFLHSHKLIEEGWKLTCMHGDFSALFLTFSNSILCAVYKYIRLGEANKVQGVIHYSMDCNNRDVALSFVLPIHLNGLLFQVQCGPQ